MTSILGLAVPVLLLVLAMKLIVGSGARFIGFNSRRAATRIHSRSGSNATGVLAAVGIAQTALDVLQRSPESMGRLGAVLTVAVMVAFVFALVVADKEAGFMLAVIGIAAALCGTIVDLGITGGLAMLALSVPLIWFFGLARGLLR